MRQLDPQTPDEWQAAVDAADFLLIVDSAQQYGLIMGGEGVNVERCVELLDRGADRGIFPSPPDRRHAHLARWLTEQRAVLNVTQRAIATRAGLHQARVSQIERGRGCDTATWQRLRIAIEAVRKEQSE